MVYAVYTTESFDKEFNKLSNEEQKRIKNIFLQLKDNPFVGDSLQIKILREKRLIEKRVYYLVFEDLKTVLIVAVNDKKAQQKTIDYILTYINEYRKYVQEILDKEDKENN